MSSVSTGEYLSIFLGSGITATYPKRPQNKNCSELQMCCYDIIGVINGLNGACKTLLLYHFCLRCALLITEQIPLKSTGKIWATVFGIGLLRALKLWLLRYNKQLCHMSRWSTNEPTREQRLHLMGVCVSVFQVCLQESYFNTSLILRLLCSHIYGQWYSMYGLKVLISKISITIRSALIPKLPCEPRFRWAVQLSLVRRPYIWLVFPLSPVSLLGGRGTRWMHTCCDSGAKEE